MDRERLSYRSATKTLCYTSETPSGELLPKSIGLELSRIARSEVYDDRPVEDALVVFSDQATAELNADPLAFLGLGSEGPKGVAKSSANFEKRSDLGMSDDPV